MVKVTCAFCKKKIDKDKAYPVKHGKRNVYYCNEEHSKAKSPRDLFLETAFEIFGRTTNTAFFKEMKEISEVHGYEKMTSYLKDNEGYLNSVMQKDFNTEYGKVRYFAAILKNQLGDYVMKKPEVKKVVTEDFFELTKKTSRKKEKRKGIDDLMKELLDD